MGCDIHGVFQRRVAETSTWEDVPSTYDERRHYQLFAVLANVRNGYGFAGVQTGQAVKSIAEPRGLPTDFAMVDDSHPVPSLALLGYHAKYWKEGEALERWMGDHSHSWLSATEMLNWWADAPTVIKTGVLSRETYEAWDKEGRPPAYCGGIVGRDIITVYDNTVDKAKKPNWTHIQCTWYSKLSDELSYFFDEVARLQKEYGEVRFVFGFDS